MGGSLQLASHTILEIIESPAKGATIVFGALAPVELVTAYANLVTEFVPSSVALYEQSHRRQKQFVPRSILAG
jgi:hypothetical protein